MWYKGRKRKKRGSLTEKEKREANQAGLMWKVPSAKTNKATVNGDGDGDTQNGNIHWEILWKHNYRETWNMEYGYPNHSNNWH